MDHLPPDRNPFPNPNEPPVQPQGQPLATDGRMPLAPHLRPDPGTSSSRLLAFILAAVLYVIVAGVQNLTPVLDMLGVNTANPVETPAPSQVEGEEPAAAQGPLVTPPGLAEQISLVGKIAIKTADLLKADAANSGEDPADELEAFAVTDADRLRLEIVRGEVNPDADPEALFAALIDTLDEDDPLHEDAQLFRRVYAGETLAPEQEQRLLDHHAYFAEVALTYNLAESDPDREALRSGGITLIVFFIIAGLIIIGGVLAGLACFVIALIKLGGGRVQWRMPVPQKGGSVFVETFAIFLAAFLAVSLIGGVIQVAYPDSVNVLRGVLLSQWLLLPILFWPLLRGAKPSQFAGALGWHNGNGFFREIFAGIFGYLAGLPLFLVGTIISFTLMVVAQLIIDSARQSMGLDPVDTAPTNPVLDLIGGGDKLTLVFIALLTVVWAPLVEETIFRGGLQRHIRGAGLGVFGASIITATLFAFMHGYGPLMVCPLIALGFTFSLLREWRGSLIASITAHALHNGFVTTLMIVVFTLLG